MTAEYYGYDAMDRLTRIVVTDGTNLISDIAWTYDADQNVTAITTRVNNNGTLRTDTYAYSYDDDHRPTNTTYGSVSESITYDGYSRVTGKTVQNSGNTVLSTSYAYRDIDAQYTTTQVSSLTNTFGGNTLSHSYTYDANGNILSDGTTTYSYDSLNQLVWEYNTAAGKAWNYAYDLGGNILSKTEYDYADGQTSNPVTVSYTYGDAVWRDLLTAYNGEAITYDGIGNPTNYRGWGMTWQGGRQLSSMQKDGTTLSFSYNDAGLRTEKTVNGSTRRYIWNSSQLMADVGASDAFYFHYSSGGELIGYTYKTADAETECILVKNQQGDVERVISADGTVLASYTYDAWGNVLTSEGSLATANPIRYRGYYFDTETSLYYLQSRYYDPATGRFINADAQVVAESSVGCNSFTYSLNSPVSMADDEGDLPFFVATAIAGAIIGAIVGGAVAAANGKNVWAGIGIGAAAGALIGTGAGMAAGAALAGSITATTGGVASGGSALVAAVGTGGFSAGATYIANNLAQAANNLAPASQTAASKMQDVAAKGKAGEALSGLTKNTTHIPSLTGTASYRIPDGLTDTVLAEVKNYSGTLSYTNQLKDFVLYSQDKVIKMHLYTNAHLTGPLQQAVDSGLIQIFPLN